MIHSSRPTTIAGAIDPRHPTRSVVRLLGLYRRPVAISFSLYVIKDSPIWFLPALTGAVIDLVVNRGPVSELLLLACVAFALLAQNYPMHVIFTRLFFGVVRRLGADIRYALAERLQLLSLTFHTRSSASVVQTKLVRDVENVEVMLQQSVPTLLSSTFTLIGAVVLTAITVPAFLPVYLLAVPVAVGLRTLLERRARARNERFRREVERLAARVGEMATLMPITRAHGLEETALQRVAARTEDVRARGVELDLLNGRFGALSWVTFQLLSVGCLVLAALASLLGWLDVTPGQIVLLSSYFGLLTGAVSQLVMLLPLIARGTESVRSIGEVLEEPDLEHNEGKKAVDSVVGALRFQGVTYRYPGDDRPAIDHLDLDIRAGETVAFVGSSGSGKSTLVSLALGLLRPSAGTLLLDGADTHDLDLRSVRRFISVVPQEPTLFEGTIRENIVYGLGDVAEERVLDALRSASALDLVTSQPEGLDTVVGERGARLSGGQRQRIAIARALIRDPRILVLDEATSALDAESESQVRDALTHLMAGRTTLIVAHRLSTVRAARRIVVLEHGRIVEIGSHQELLDRGGRFADLHARQVG